MHKIPQYSDMYLISDFHVLYFFLQQKKAVYTICKKTKDNIMKLYTSFFVMAISSLAINAFGALPPLYQSIREYKALIESPELSQLGSAEMIKEIQRDETGFTVLSERKTLHVDVVYDPQDQPGPVKFHLEFPKEP